MWAGNLLVANRPRKLSLSSTGDDDHTWLTKNASPRIATRRKPLSSRRRKLPASARQRRVALSRMASKMGCKSCGELAMARSTSEMAACCPMSSITRSCSSDAVLRPYIPSFMGAVPRLRRWQYNGSSSSSNSSQGVIDVRFVLNASEPVRSGGAVLSAVDPIAAKLSQRRE
jgi:hypothetical protein